MKTKKIPSPTGKKKECIKEMDWYSDSFTYAHHNYIERKYTYEYEKLLKRLGVWIKNKMNKEVGLLRGNDGNLFESIDVRPELKLTIVLKEK